MFSNMFKKIPLLSLSQLADEANLPTKVMKDILIEEKYIEENGKWIIGKKSNIETKYNAKTKIKYVLIPQNILEHHNIIDKITKASKKRPMSIQEKKEKGDKYEKYVSSFFKQLGYTTVEYGLIKGKEDNGIDLFLKKEKHFYFVQCKNWDAYKINHKEIKATRQSIRDYLDKNKNLDELIKNGDYTTKIFFITSKDCLSSGAKKYIQEYPDDIEHIIIKME